MKHKRCKTCRKPLEIPATGRKPRYCGQVCKNKAYRYRRRKVETAHGGNAEMIRDVARLYIRDGDMVADVTFGTGTFWRKTDTSRFTLLATDLLHTDPDKRHDFRQLPYTNGGVDVVILDPPYGTGTNKPMFEERYRNGATTKGMSHKAIMRLYAEGMEEARRVLKVGGLLWVKCADATSGKRFLCSHVEVYQAALALGFRCRDLFVVVPSAKTSHWGNADQQAARRTHSYLWVFERSVS